MNVMIVVTHLLGSGHLSRALTLARAFDGAGHRVTLVTGGMPAPHLDAGGVDMVQLPPLQSDGTDFSRLVDADGAPVDDPLLERRKTTLIETLNRTAPDALITELFPFGRRSLRTEFLALLDAAQSMRHRPVICASIRDILAPPSKPARAEQTAAWVSDYYDAVLVHADADITPLPLSWPVSPSLEVKLHYTGFVAPAAPLPHPDGTGAGEVIVSAGGGDVGSAIFAAALAAAARDDKRRWRVLVGGGMAPQRIAELTADAPGNVIVQAARPDFRQMLHHAAASVSMCGYNTALDLLQTGCPAVLVPFDAGSEVEQGIRAEALARRPGIAVLRNAALLPDSLLAALAEVTAAPRRTPMTQGMDGARATIGIVEGLAASR